MITTFFDKHSLSGAILTIIGLVTGYIPTLLEIRIPTFIMQLFQIAVWSITIIIGIFTLLALIKKHLRK